jgi:hypothetical protein
LVVPTRPAIRFRLPSRLTAQDSNFDHSFYTLRRKNTRPGQGGEQKSSRSNDLLLFMKEN